MGDRELEIGNCSKSQTQKTNNKYKIPNHQKKRNYNNKNIFNIF